MSAHKKNPLDDLIMGTEDAAAEWEISQDHVKRLCREGKCVSKLIGKTWVLLRNQPNPTKK